MVTHFAKLVSNLQAQVELYFHKEVDDVLVFCWGGGGGGGGGGGEEDSEIVVGQSEEQVPVLANVC